MHLQNSQTPRLREHWGREDRVCNIDDQRVGCEIVSLSDVRNYTHNITPMCLPKFIYDNIIQQ